MKSVSIFIISIIAFILILDLYTYRGVRIITGDLNTSFRMIIAILFWLVPIALIALIIILGSNLQKVFTTPIFRWWYFCVGIFALFYIPKLIIAFFMIINDLMRIAGFVISKIFVERESIASAGATMSRSDFLIKAGIIISMIPFVAIFHGIVKGRFNYKVKNVRLSFDNLPSFFNGFKVLQISDWHIGSFYFHADKVQESIELINMQNADIILFTGDLVNNMAFEVEQFIPLLKQIKARLGVYSVLGNHDYGEYVPWESKEKHEQNMQELYKHIKESGMILLRNESVVIEQNGQQIGIAGVENWGLHPFPQYGDLKKALTGVTEIPFKILMSHDPSHWDAEILGRSDVDLTLSGHTHGMQFGINIPGLKWSPVQWKYPRWMGLYKEGNQYLYVNAGIGYIGFPGRVGFYPEITVFELHTKNDKAIKE